MLLSLKHTGHLPIVSQTSAPLGRTTRGIIDPDKGCIVAYEIGSHPAAYLACIDIAGYADDVIVTTVPDAIQSKDDLIRLKPFVESKLKPLGLKVVDEQGKRLGKVSDYIFDSTDHLIVRIHIEPGLLKKIVSNELILPRERIVRITPTEVVVRYDGSVTSKAGVPAETEPI